MSKKKTELDIATEKVELLIKETNNKISELGQETSLLYDALNTIQLLFDKIRNVPSEELKKNEEIRQVTLTWKKLADKIKNDYDAAIKVQMGGGAATATLGAGIAFLGPSAAMGVATTFGVASTGTAIASLHGAVATNAALAWLGGGALAAGGGGMAAGKALLALAGPIGWGIAAAAFLGSIFFFWRTSSQKKALNRIFLLISEREQKKYTQAIVELNERIVRVKDETNKLKAAIIEIQTFGLDYNRMSEAQQYALGSYVNLMNSSAQLLVNPILGLQPNFTEKDLDEYLKESNLPQLLTFPAVENKQLFIYLVNLLYNIKLTDSELKLLAKTFRKNKEFIQKVGCKKEEISYALFTLVHWALLWSYEK